MLHIVLVFNLHMCKDAQASSIKMYLMGCSLHTLDGVN